MKAIEVKYKGPTDKRGSRIIASDCDGNKLVVSTNDERINRLNFDKQCEIVANMFKDKMAWSGNLAGGWLKKGYVFVFVD